MLGMYTCRNDQEQHPFQSSPDSHPIPHPVSCDVSGKWVGGGLKEVKEHVLLDIFVLFQEVPHLVGDWTSIVLDT